MVLTVQHLGTKCEPSAPPEKQVPYTTRHRHLGYTEGMSISFTIHRQTYLDDLGIHVDERLAEIIPLLHKRGIPTAYSCQGALPGEWVRTPTGNSGYIAVKDEQGMERLEAMAREMPWVTFEKHQLGGESAVVIRWGWEDIDRTLAALRV